MKTTSILLLLSILSVSLALNYPVRGDIKRTLKSLEAQGQGPQPQCPPDRDGDSCRQEREENATDAKRLEAQGQDRPHCPPGEDCRPPRDDDAPAPDAKRLEADDTQDDGEGPEHDGKPPKGDSDDEGQDGEDRPPRGGKGPKPDAKRLEERKRRHPDGKRLDADATEEDDGEGPHGDEDGEGPAEGEERPRRGPGGKGPKRLEENDAAPQNDDDHEEDGDDHQGPPRKGDKPPRDGDRPDGDHSKRLDQRRRHPGPAKRLSMNHPEADAFCARLKAAWGTCGAEMGCAHSWDECSASAECMRVATRMYGMRDSGNGTCNASDEACLRDQEDWNDANGCLADHELAQEDDDEQGPEHDGKPPKRMRGPGPNEDAPEGEDGKRLEERKRRHQGAKRLDADAPEEDDGEAPAEGEHRPRRGGNSDDDSEGPSDDERPPRGKGPKPDAKRLEASAEDAAHHLDDPHPDDGEECPEPQHDGEEQHARMLAKKGGKPPKRGCGPQSRREREGEEDNEDENYVS